MYMPSDNLFLTLVLIIIDETIISLAKEVEVAKAEVAQLQERYIDITSRAAEDMSGNITVRKLHYSVLCLPPNLKKEHKTFIEKAKADIKKAESIDDVLIEVGAHCDFLNYYLLKYIIDLYGSDDMKKEMVTYVERVKVFRRETQLEVFSEVYNHKREKAKNCGHHKARNGLGYCYTGRR